MLFICFPCLRFQSFLTLQGVQPSLLEKWRKLEALCSPLNNFKGVFAGVPIYASRPLTNFYQICAPSTRSVQSPLSNRRVRLLLLCRPTWVDFELLVVAIFLKDLTFIEDGHETFVDKEKKFFNVTKIRQMGKLLARIEDAQRTRYDIQPQLFIQGSCRSFSCVKAMQLLSSIFYLDFLVHLRMVTIEEQETLSKRNEPTVET